MLHNFENLKVDQAQKKIVGQVLGLYCIDKHTRQHIVYCPSLEISGYGDTKEKAIEMFNFSINEFLKFLVESKAEIIQSELTKLGWKPDKYFRKEFSKAPIDEASVLQELNAEPDSVERVNLALAA